MAQAHSGDETKSVNAESNPRVIARKHDVGHHPSQIGPYRILETLGEGGMGIVFLAEQTSPIHRRVALKIIKAGMDTRQVTARFETEREALALINHPNVAKVFDAGATETGRPYFVMEYVSGIPITEYCDKHRLNTEERLRLFMDVCHAVQHAHQKGIIHRDIKPSNVLVMVQDDKPVPKVIDFGVAKATQHRLTERTLFTEQGQLIGTPGYMSPEQAEMTALDIDTRTDVYSLGVLLYELLVGALPFDSEQLLRAGLAEIQRIIREVDPPKPSTKLSMMQSEPQAPATSESEPCPSGSGPQPPAPAEYPLPHGRGSDRGFGSSIDGIAHYRHTEPKTLIRQIRGDLDWIVMKCLEKDRTRRYETANDLVFEIGRYFNNEPITARPPGAIYLTRKFIRRYKWPVAYTSTVIIALVIGLFSMGELYLRANWARTDANIAVAKERMGRARLVETVRALRSFANLVASSGSATWVPEGGLVNRWNAIVVHACGSKGQDISEIDGLHREKGLDEIAYHFVIAHDPLTSADGLIAPTSRWFKQKHGFHVGRFSTSRSGEKMPENYYNEHGIGICLIGNFHAEEPTEAQLLALRSLCAWLIRQCSIPPEAVLSHSEIDGSKSCPGPRLNMNDLRTAIVVSPQATYLSSPIDHVTP